MSINPLPNSSDKTMNNSLVEAKSLPNSSDKIMNNLLIDVNNPNISEEKCVERTEILRKAFVEKILAKSEPGIDRSLYLYHTTATTDLIGLYSSLHGMPKDKELALRLNTMTNQKGHSLMCREQTYWITDGKPYINGRDYSSTKEIVDMQSQGLLTDHTPWNFRKGKAIEVSVAKFNKSMTKELFKIITFYIDTFKDLRARHKLLYTIKEMYKVEAPRMYHSDPGMEWAQMLCDCAAEAHFTSKDTWKSETLQRKTWYVLEMGERVDTEGVTEQLIRTMVNQFCPGFQVVRKAKLTVQLLQYYGVGQKVQEVKVAGKLGIEYVALHMRALQSSIYGIFQNTSYIEYLVDYIDSPSNSITPSALETPALPADSRTSPSTFDPAPCSLSTPEPLMESPLPSASSSDLLCPTEDIQSYREDAAHIMGEESEYINSCFNEALLNGVLSYAPLDASDTRQQAIMSSEGPLPYEYKLMSPASPRVYGRGVDNLFYCRKEMRLHAMEGIGFKDVDLENCHANIALGLWGDQLPILKECLSQGSLWQHYEEYFESKGLTFYKPLVKAFHHATFLSGGNRAYAAAWNRYNQSHTEAPIQESEFQRIRDTFKNSPVCKELKALHKKLENEWDGNIITVPTKESFKVRKSNWAAINKCKKEGKDYSQYEGNFPTALSALLQSIEVSLVSYMIIRCRALFLPILWQHDGLTIKALYSNTVELMQESVNEFCDTYLGGHRMHLTCEDL